MDTLFRLRICWVCSGNVKRCYVTICKVLQISSNWGEVNYRVISKFNQATDFNRVVILLQTWASLKAKDNRWCKKMLPRIEVYKVSIYTLVSELSNNSVSWSCHFCHHAPTPSKPPQNPLLLSLALRPKPKMLKTCKMLQKPGIALK